MNNSILYYEMWVVGTVGRDLPRFYRGCISAPFELPGYNSLTRLPEIKLNHLET
jgi:hypothetical protein